MGSGPDQHVRRREAEAENPTIARLCEQGSIGTVQCATEPTVLCLWEWMLLQRKVRPSVGSVTYDWTLVMQGDSGAGAKIPGGATLVFDVELVSID